MNKKVLELLRNEVLSVSEIASVLKISGGLQFTQINKEINELIEDGILFEEKGKIYYASNYEKGNVTYRNGYTSVDHIPLLNSDEYGLFDGDEIYYKETRKGAECIHVSSRKNMYVMGTIVYRKGRMYFYSDERKFADFDCINIQDFKKQLKENCRVRAYISDYRNRKLKIDTVLGPSDKDETLINSILLMNNAITRFPNAALKECESIDEKVLTDNRRDLRSLNIITIDGDDAKDYDDAIYVEEYEEGYKLYVSIADVSYYVTKGSELDKSALKRGTSIYYPGHVIPMLPDKLCNNLCSLVEGEDRYTITCEMHVTYEGEIKEYEIYPSVINSKHRMTYTNVNAILEHDSLMLDKYDDITHMIYKAYELSRIIDKHRKAAGGIEFDSSEPIIIEENDKVTDIRLRVQGKAETLIEDFMIAANETVATHMHYLDLPLIYRNHNYPKTEKIEKFVELARNLGYTFKGNIYELKSSQLQKCLNTFENTPEFSVVSDTMLRCMSKALYESTSDIHYGLGLEHYCHFTSPIRRYPDLMVHRMLRKYVFNTDNYEDIEDDNLSNSIIASKCNESEKKAVQIERAVLDLKKCEYMKDKIGLSFDAIISSVVSFGFYVKLDNTVEGLVHISNLGNDYYLDNLDNLTNGDRIFKLGDRVKVKLVDVDIIKRNIDFDLIKKYED